MSDERKTATYSIGQATYDRINELAEQTQRNPGKVIDLAIASMTPARLNRIARILSEQDSEADKVPA